VASEGTYEIVYQDLQIVNPPLGHGSYGVVNKAEFRGSNIAVKTFMKSASSTQRSIDDFKKEIDVLRKIHHPNTVLLIGMCANPLAIVMEYCERGSLLDIIKGSPEDLNLQRTFSISLDCARGMAYLHGLSPPIIHRDLKTSNILITKTWIAKIGDFGISRESTNTTMTSSAGTPRWMAPEVMSSGYYSAKADIYSFAVVMWEMAAKKLPFEESQFSFEIHKAVLDGKRMPIPEDTLPVFKELIEKCWTAVPEQRPTFLQIIAALKKNLPDSMK
jgi:serine/threonine protein kinase